METTFAYDGQISSQPEAAKEALSRIEVPPLHRNRPIIFTGIGTSYHACRVAAAWVAQLTGGALRPVALDTHELALTAPLTAEDQIVVVSHRGNKRFPNEVLARARSVGATTITITGYGTPELGSDYVLRTCPDDQASAHTVSYVTALVVLGRLVAQLGGDTAKGFVEALDAVPAALEQTLRLPGPPEAAERLLGLEPVLFTGFGLDAVTVDEAALKYKEGTYTWAEGMMAEVALHGTPAVFRPGMGAVTLIPIEDDGGRTADLRTLLGSIDVEILTCGDGDTDLPFAPVHPLVRPLVAIVPLQRLVSEVARKKGANPDTTRMDEEPWASAIAEIVL